MIAHFYSLLHSDMYIFYNLFIYYLLQEILVASNVLWLMNKTATKLCALVFVWHTFSTLLAQYQPKSIIGVYTKTMLIFVKICQNPSKVITILHIPTVTNERSYPRHQHSASSAPCCGLLDLGLKHTGTAGDLLRSTRFTEEVEAS